MLTYSHYPDEGAAAAIKAQLEAAGIPYVLEKEAAFPDKVYFGQSTDIVYALKLAPEDFSRMNDLLEAQAKRDAATPDPDYYLYSFSPAELKDVVDHPQEWNPYDVALARILYEKSGAAVQTLSNDIIPDYKPERIKPYWLVLGYLAALLSFPGVIIGAGIRSARKTLSNGESVPLFDLHSRNHGTAIFAIGMFMLFRFLLRIILN